MLPILVSDYPSFFNSSVSRGREHLVLALPQFIWKRLVGEEVTWDRDFISVDSDQVRNWSSWMKLDYGLGCRQKEYVRIYAINSGLQ